jgi:hypothetical protein
MSNQGELYDSLESIVAKLYVLRDSCTGIMHTEKSNPNLIWSSQAIRAEGLLHRNNAH